MTVIAMPSRWKRPPEVDEREEEYRHRMLVNLVAASFITVLIIGGYWVVSTLAGVV
jgi:hypothetical protein